jgi:hypothetical protein
MIDQNFSSEPAPAQLPGVARDQMMELAYDLLFHGPRFTVPVKDAA